MTPRAWPEPTSHALPADDFHPLEAEAGAWVAFIASLMTRVERWVG